MWVNYPLSEDMFGDVPPGGGYIPPMPGGDYNHPASVPNVPVGSNDLLREVIVGIIVGITTALILERL